MNPEDHEFQELAAEMRDRLIGVTGKMRDEIAMLLARVLERIPEEDRTVLRFFRNLRVIMPVDHTAAVIYVNFRFVDERHREMIPVWFICLSPDFGSQPESECIYLLAHELAHVFLEHNMDGSNGKDQVAQRKNQEIHADQLVQKWGFREELQSYYSGPQGAIP